MTRPFAYWNQYPERRARSRLCGMATRRHGASRPDSPLFGTYRSWQAMKQRCDNPHDSFYGRYGGRGIRYDTRWTGFDAFLADMGPRPDGTTLDRIDNDGPYSPDNCRWATLSEQRRNHPQPSGWKVPNRAPATYATMPAPCNGGCGRTGEVITTAARGWRCPDCKRIARRGYVAKHRAKPGKPPCSEADCDAPVHCRGLCSKHYQRAVRHSGHMPGRT